MDGRQRRSGLLVGGGGALGGAWAVGALCALAEVEGYDPALSADLLVGTSAGSVLAAMLACGVSLEVMYERLSGSRAEDVAGTGPVNPFAVTDHVHAALGKVALPTLAPGNLSLAARTLGAPQRYTMMTMAAGFAPRGRGSLQPITDLISGVAGVRPWPTQPRTWIVAMDFDSGKRVTFGRALTRLLCRWPRRLRPHVRHRGISPLW
jgi:NTE family protein